jgi:hypothetical protein
MNNNYDAVYRNTGTTPRKMHRVEDHYAIHTFKSDTEKATKFFIDMVVGILMVGLPLVAIYGLMVWLDLLK